MHAAIRVHRDEAREPDSKMGDSRDIQLICNIVAAETSKVSYQIL